MGAIIGAMLGTGALIIAIALLLLFLNARAYAERAERRWPPLGRMIEAGGARLHVVERGPEDAPRVLLIHGASANLREVLGPLAALADDHRVIAFDRPGYGYSARPRGSEQLKAQAALAAAALDQTGRGPAVIVAHSLGSAVALRLALERPDLVRGLVLVAPASHPYPGPNAWWARLAAAPVAGDVFAGLFVPWLGPAMAKAGIANNFGPGGEPPADYWDDAGVGLFFRPAAFQASARDVIASRAEFSAQAPLYGGILAPVVIVTADKDRVVNPKIHARALAAELAHAELVIAPGAGHMPHRLRTDLVINAVARVEAMAAASDGR